MSVAEAPPSKCALTWCPRRHHASDRCNTIWVALGVVQSRGIVPSNSNDHSDCQIDHITDSTIQSARHKTHPNQNAGSKPLGVLGFLNRLRRQASNPSRARPDCTAELAYVSTPTFSPEFSLQDPNATFKQAPWADVAASCKGTPLSVFAEVQT